MPVPPCEWVVLSGSLLATLIHSTMELAPKTAQSRRYTIHGKTLTRSVARDDSEFEATYAVVTSLGVRGGLSQEGEPLGVVVCRTALEVCTEPTPEDITDAQQAYPHGCLLLFMSHAPSHSATDTSTLHIHYSVYFIVPVTEAPLPVGFVTAWEVPLTIDSLVDSAYRAMCRTIEVLGDYGSTTDESKQSSSHREVEIPPLSEDVRRMLDVYSTRQELLRKVHDAHSHILHTLKSN